MSTRLRSVLSHAASFALAGVLLYFALRGVDFAEMGRALRDAEYLWLLPLAVFAIASHVLRSWRWQILLEELPDAAGEHKRVRIFNAFSALIIGYLTNYAAPRLGEVVRAGVLSRREHMSVSGVFGTVVVERVLDVIVLGLLLVATFGALIDQSEVVRELFLYPVAARFGQMSIGAVVVTILVTCAVGFGAILLIRRWRRSSGRLRSFVDQFMAGIASVKRTRRWGAITLSTILMWFCYAWMAYLPFVMLGMTEPFEITFLDAWHIMVLGSIGVAIPAPGGTGSYHYVTIQSLIYLFGVTQAPAATYAVLTHAAQMILYTALGGFFLATGGVGSVTSVEKNDATGSAEAGL